MPTPIEIRQLDQWVLDSVFAGQALPGTSSAVALPDVAHFLRYPAIILSDEGLAGDLSADSLPKPLRVMSVAALKSESYESEIAYLRFNNEVLDADRVRVTLEARIFSRKGEPAGLGLSAVHVTFRRRNGEWTVEDSPAISAA